MNTEGVCGLPPGIAANREALTPMLSQYADLCADYGEALVLFQVGDFYQCFCEAAEAIARDLELTLTKREDSTGTYPMAGIPIDNAASYLEGLLERGYRIALAEQVEDPDDASGPVDRAVTEVLTPGTLVDDALLEPGTSNYVACLVGDGEPDSTDALENGSRPHTETTHALALADVSTGEFLATSGDRRTVADELERFAPAEVLVAPGVDIEALDRPTTREIDPLDADAATDRITEAGATTEPLTRAERRACGSLFDYIVYTTGDADSDRGVNDAAAANGSIPADRNGETAVALNPENGRFKEITRYEPADHLRLDATALRSLDVFENRTGERDRTLISVLDRTASALGRRRLADWVRRPLLDREAIAARHDAVEALVADSLSRTELRELLSEVYDLARLTTRVSRERATARDLRSLADTLRQVPAIHEALSSMDTDALDALRERLVDLSDVRELIERAIEPDPPIELTEGGLIDPDFDADLAALRETERGGKEWVAALEATERERTGIDSLSVGYNQVHGYYIEVTNANLERVPEGYTRRQTLKNAERYYTPELKRREDEIVSAGERADKREYELFREVRAAVGAEAERIDRVAEALADLDALCALAAVAVENEYTRPELVGSDDALELRGARHPVVETTTEFVANDAVLEPGEVALVTGPNMAGKSTYMRQVALCVLLAQIGGFVPAREARLPPIDRVFTRVGAADDIAGGQSTFMREMDELATILREATSNSLVVIDEVGRGTSTTDGRAIARAATERLHDAVGARTLFATHYHELTDLAASHDRMTNYHFAADRSAEEVTFLHSVAEGAASASYGVDVARLAGVPDSVVARSRALVERTDANEGDRTGTEAGEHSIETDAESIGETPIAAGNGPTSKRTGNGSSEVEGGIEPGESIEGVLRELDIANTTPVEALCTLNELIQRLDDRSEKRTDTN